MTFKEISMLTNGTLREPLVMPPRVVLDDSKAVPLEGLNGAPRGRLSEKVAIITGAATGIGRTMARVFASEGARVVIADIDGEKGLGTAAELNAEGWEAWNHTTDITKPDQVAALIASTEHRFGRVDVLVNNAGAGLNCPFLDTTLADWQRLMDVVLTGTFLCAQAAARSMLAQGRGAIINVASISGQRGAQGRAAYGTAKAGVIQLTRIMAVELAAKGIRVNAISPGPVVTEQSLATHTNATRQSYLDRIPLHRYGERAEVAAAALFLASDDASFVHGHILNVDGGFGSAGLMFDADAD
jgi:NAD(P)-dependent dehydrogenase (short-subunit alcohol dehydrogenase family)